MAISYYKKYTPLNDMSDEDYNTYKNNKYVAEKYGDADGSRKAQNDALRQKYNITSDDYSYDQLDTMDRVNALGQNKWDRQADAVYNGLNSYKNYPDKYAANVQRAYDELRNFQYNPNTDPNFKAYADMYARQGAAAQDKTYSKLTALSGGRNNSWASAATAQVGQAYAQKTADMIPQLAEQAYNKLLQQYNIDVDRSERDYSRFMDKYNIDTDLYALANDRANMYRDIIRGQEDYEMNRSSWSQDYNLNEKYADAERAAALENTQLANEEARVMLSYLPQQIQNEIMQGNLSIEQQLIVNRYLEGDLLLDQTIKELEAMQMRKDLNNSGSGGRVTGNSNSDSNEVTSYDTDFASNFIDSINDYAANYNQVAIVENSDGTVSVNSAYKDRMIYQMFNDDSLTNEQRQYLMTMFDISYDDVDKFSNSKSRHGDMRVL